MSARTIDEVIEHLDDLIAHARRAKSRLGYFAALYRNVTIKVKEGILAGSFEDAARMERFDVMFANRYLGALERYRRGEEPGKCWRTSSRRRELASHSLATSPAWHQCSHQSRSRGCRCPNFTRCAAGRLGRGFDTINDLLCAMLDDVQDRLALVSPWMSMLDRAGGRTDEEILNFSLYRARQAAWRVAERLAPLGPEEMQKEIEVLDRWVDVLAFVIRYPPGISIRLATLFVRFTEGRDVAKIIDILT